MNFYTSTRGNKNEAAVVLLHGLLGSSRNMMRIQEALSNSGFYTLSFDQRGHGHSPHFHKTDYTLDFLVKDLFQIADHFEIKKMHIVGHSLGGRVSMLAVAKEPSRFLSLSMLDVGLKVNPTAQSDLHKIIDPLPHSFQNKEEAALFLQNSIPLQGKQKTMFEQFLLSNLRTKNNKLEWNFHLDGIRTSLLNSLLEDHTESWTKVTIPTLVLRGELSEHFLENELENMHHTNLHMQSHTISNAGHWLHVENLNDTVMTLLNFLKQTREK